MCIIIVKPKGKTIEKELLHYCWKKNNDGGGFAYAENNKIKIYKELEDFEKFWSLYESHVKNPKARNDKTKTREELYNVLIHFRIGTSGEVNKTNIHPFLVNDTYAFAHNGIITSIDIPVKSVFSDTYVFNEILRDMPLHWIKNQSQRILVKNFIGLGSKLAFIDKKGNYRIMREDKGDWDTEDTGCWFSNLGYKGWAYWGKDSCMSPIDHSLAGGLGYVAEEGYHTSDRRHSYKREEVQSYPNNVLPLPVDRQAQSINRNLSELQRLGPGETASDTVTLVNKKSAYNEQAFGSCGYCGMIIYSKKEIIDGKCSFCTQIGNISQEGRKVNHPVNLH